MRYFFFDFDSFFCYFISKDNINILIITLNLINLFLIYNNNQNFNNIELI